MPTSSFRNKTGCQTGDPLSANLFNYPLEGVYQKLNCESKGIKNNGAKLNNLRFADDVVLISQDGGELQKMASEFEEGLKVGLHINMQKSVLISYQKSKLEIILGNKKVTVTRSTIYLGQSLPFENNLENEISRRRAQAWKNFLSLRGIYKSKMTMKVKKKILESCTLPVLTYGSQTWATTEAQNLKLSRTETANGAFPGWRRDEIRNTYIRKLTGAIKKLKLDYAGHVARGGGRISGKEGCWNGIIQGIEGENQESQQLDGKVK